MFQALTGSKSGFWILHQKMSNEILKRSSFDHNIIQVHSTDLCITRDYVKLGFVKIIGNTETKVVLVVLVSDEDILDNIAEGF